MKPTYNQESIREEILSVAASNYAFVYNTCKEIKRIDKKTYKTINSDVERRLKKMENVRPSYNNPNNNALFGLLYVLDMPLDCEYFMTSINTNTDDDLRIWLRDKDFKIFYKKVLIVLTYLENNKYFIDMSDIDKEQYTYFLLTKSGVLFTYFLNKEPNITVEKVKSFLSKAFHWKATILSFSPPLNNEQEIIFNEIKTGVKYIKHKNNPTRKNMTYKKQEQYNVLDDMKNNIKIQYISGLNNKHRFHKLPIVHWRNGHWRYSKNGTKVWIEGKYVGGNQEKSYAA